jgi:hypothetical protein
MLFCGFFNWVLTVGCHITDLNSIAIIADEVQEMMFKSLCCGFKW